MGHMDSGNETVRFGAEKPNLPESLWEHRAHPLTPQGARRGRILVAEDDADLRSLIQCALEIEQYEVFSFGNGLRALEIFRGNQDIDLLITDMQMPLLSGEELAKGLWEFHPKLAILFISGRKPSAQLKDLIRERPCSFLAKPFSLLELLDAVHHMMGVTGLPA